MNDNQIGFGKRLKNRIALEYADRKSLARLKKIEAQVDANAPAPHGIKPVVFFKASTDLIRMSLNSAFHMVAAWSLKLQGVPVVHFACRSGMSRCVLGTDKDHPEKPMPCAACTAHSDRLLANAQVRGFRFQADESLDARLQTLDLAGLEGFEHRDLPLGKLVLPSLRWVLRRHNLPGDEPVRYLYREYIRSAWSVAQEFSALLDETDPQAVVMFNGMFFPEATARTLARQRGIRVISHEVAMRPYTAFFTEGEATAYPISIPADFELTARQNERLDHYLEERFKGNFSMAGIRFWPEMQRLPEEFVRRIESFRQIVPVFTNVVFDTSQPHSNVIFSDMFVWLETVSDLIRRHPDTLFVIRAHPDEKRKWKESRETVADWVHKHDILSLPNAAFFDSDEFVSSYELIERSKFVMVYNSSIGLEASLMGKAVLSGGKARYTQIPTVFFPPDRQAYHEQAECFLAADKIEPPEEFRCNARKFLYFQLYRTSLPFQDYLEPHILPGFVGFRDFSWQALLPENSATLRVISEGVLEGKPFLVDEEA